MSWTEPRTWVAGEVVTKAHLDEQIRDNMSVLHAPVTSMIPKPVLGVVGASGAVGIPANVTEAQLGVIYVPRPITVEQLCYCIAAGGGATSEVRIALYAEDGQTKLIDVTDTCGAAAGVRTVDVDPDLDLEAGNYIVLICHSVYDTAAKTILRFTTDGTFVAHIASEPDLSGTLTIIAGAAPATIDPEAYTGVGNNLIPVVRLLGA